MLRQSEREAEKMSASLARAEEEMLSLRGHCAQLEQKRAEESHHHRTKVQARIGTKMSFSLSQKKVKFSFHEWYFVMQKKTFDFRKKSFQKCFI